MNRQAIRTTGAALGWLAGPLVPVGLASACHNALGEFFVGFKHTDPRVWTWFEWTMLLGPLWGYGFLAGVTLGVPDDPGQRRWRSRRAVWVGIGPWAGFLVWTAIFWIFAGLNEILPDRIKERFNNDLRSWHDTWTAWAVWWGFVVLLLATLFHAWLFPAVAALRRARRTIGFRRALRRGLATSVAFVGSLVGVFWAVTEGFRAFFFDARAIPLLLVALGLIALSGCSGTVTYGDVRRQDLFSALLLSWVFGLALFCQWWGRPRGKPPGGA